MVRNSAHPAIGISLAKRPGSTGGAGTISVEENDVVVDAATSSLDFLGADFDVTSAPAGEANVSLAATLNANARIAVRKNTGAVVGTRRRLNLIEGTNITLTIADDGVDEEVDITVTAASGSAGHTIREDGVDFTARVGLNFLEPDGVLLTDDGVGNETEVNMALYGKLLGRAGGQALHGGTAASNPLNLRSTSHATKGLITAIDQLICGSESDPSAATASVIKMVGPASTAGQLTHARISGTTTASGVGALMTMFHGLATLDIQGNALGTHLVLLFAPTISDTVGGGSSSLTTASVQGTVSGVGNTYPAFTGVDTSGTVTSGTVTARIGFVARNIGGAGTITSQIGFQANAITNTTTTERIGVRVADQTTGNTVSMTSYGIQIDAFDADADGIQFPFAYGDRTAEKTYIRRDGSMVVAQFVTLGNEVHRITSEATGDDPTEVVVQNRVTTTDATATVIHTVAIPTSTVVYIEAKIVARRTGGTAAVGATGDGYAAVVRNVYRNVAGTVTEGTPTTGAELDWESAHDALWGSADIVVSGTNATVRVAGKADMNVTWHATIRTYQVGS